MSGEPSAQTGGRVCFLISSFYPVVGGAERASQALGTTMASQGEDVLILTRRYPGTAPRDRVDGLEVERKGLPVRGKFGALTYGIHAVLSLATRHRRYRVLHVMNPDTPLLVGFLARLLLRRRLFITVHSDPHVVLQARGWSGPLRLDLIGRLAEGVGSLTEEMRGQLLDLGVPDDRIHILPNGVDTNTYRVPPALDRVEARHALQLADDTVMYVFVGRLEVEKRVDLLLEAWARLDGSSAHRTLVVVGDGSLRPELESQCEKLELSTVRFEGSRSNVIDYLNAADVFVLPSDREGQSVALLEAMATGLTPVVSDVPGNCAMVKEGSSGLIFPVGDAEALTRALDRAGSPELRSQIAPAAAAVGAENSLRRTAALHLALYGHSGSDA